MSEPRLPQLPGQELPPEIRATDRALLVSLAGAAQIPAGGAVVLRMDLPAGAFSLEGSVGILALNPELRLLFARIQCPDAVTLFDITGSGNRGRGPTDDEVEEDPVNISTVVSAYLELDAPATVEVFCTGMGWNGEPLGFWVIDNGLGGGPGTATRACSPRSSMRSA